MGCYRCGSERGTETRLCPSCAQKRIEERGRVRDRTVSAPKGNNTLNMVLTVIIGIMIGVGGVIGFGIYKAKKTVEDEFASAFEDMILEARKDIGANLDVQTSENWVEKNIPAGSVTMKSIVNFNNNFSVEILNPKEENMELNHYIVQYDVAGNVLNKELLKRTLGPRRGLSKKLILVPGAVNAKLKDAIEFDSMVKKDGWEDTVYRKELIGTEEPTEDGLVSSSSSGVSSCLVFISNVHKPKHIEIYLNHLDAFNGNIIRTDKYEYDIGYNRIISREFPFIPGEKFCRVETSDHRAFMEKFKKHN